LAGETLEGDVTSTLSDVRAGRLAVTPLTGVVGFAIRGEIDQSNRSILAAALLDVVAHGGDVHLDMTEVSFVDVGTAALLVELAERLRPRGELLVHHPPYELSYLLSTLWPGTASIEAEQQ
jgi:ABC-type transporter Mla MlaB component